MGLEQHLLWVYRRWRRLVFVTLFGTVVGLVLAFVLPDHFTVTLVVEPSSGDATQLSGNLAAIASKFGVQPNVDNSPLDFFALVVQSDTLLRTILRKRFAKGSVAPDSSAGPPFSEYYGASPGADEQAFAKAVKRLQKDLSVNSDVPSGTIAISLELTDRELALGAARAMVLEANRYLERVNSEIHRAERVFLDDQVNQAQLVLNLAEDSLQRFYERNRGFSPSSELHVQEGRLLRRVQIAQDRYLALSGQLGDARLAEARNTPVLAMVDPGVLPAPPTLLRRVAMALAVGFVVTLFWTGWSALRSLVDESQLHT
jgi:uncharacterized protein involved in exopolysaccharide biosynthesis